MDMVFFEIIVDAAEASLIGLQSRDEIEGPLEKMFAVTGFGEVTGGGAGGGVYIIDVEVNRGELDEALLAIKNVLRGMRLPIGTKIKKGKPDRTEISIYDSP